MDIWIILLIGIIVGALDGGGIFFVKKEPYKLEIFLAALLKSSLVSFMLSLLLSTSNTVWDSIWIGAVVGTLFALIVFLAKGAFASGDAPLVVPFGLVWGALTGYLVLIFVIA